MTTKSTFIERLSLPFFLIITFVISLAIPLFLAFPTELMPLMVVFVLALMAITLTAATEEGKGMDTLLKKSFQWRMRDK